MFCMPEKLYEPLILGSVSPTFDVGIAGCWGERRSAAKPKPNVSATVDNVPPEIRVKPIFKALSTTKLKTSPTKSKAVSKTSPTKSNKKSFSITDNFFLF